MKSVIAYYRVSTVKQGRSGLGLEAQQHIIKHHCKSNKLKLLQEVIEVRSTRKRRVLLEQAISYCQKNKVALIVATLDRLGRDVEEIAHNIKLPIEIIVADNPLANRFTIHILAAVAEEQRRIISVNTKRALDAARRRGVKLGTHGAELARRNKQAADKFALKIQPLFLKLSLMGIRSTRKVAAELNRLNIPTVKVGGKWHRTTVWNYMTRLRKMKRRDGKKKCLT